VGDVVGLMRSFQRMSEALISRLDRDEARVPVPPEGPQRAPAGTGSIHRELEKVKFPEFLGATDGASRRGMVGEHGDVLRTSRLHLQHESLHGGISAEGECSSMVEDAPATTEHGLRRRVMGTVRGVVLGEVFV
jgi:hypothetical protein